MMTVKETIDPKVFTYQITNEYGERQPFTVLNLYRHIGYPKRVIRTTMSDGNESVINLAKRYLPLTLTWYGEQRLMQFHDSNRKYLTTPLSNPIERVLKAYRAYTRKIDFHRTPETEAMVRDDRDRLVPVLEQELVKFTLTAENHIINTLRDDVPRKALIEMLAQRILIRIIIEDGLALKMEADREITDIDNAQAKALNALCGGNKTGVDKIYGLYMDRLKDLSLMEVNIIFNKIHAHLSQIAEEETEARKAETVTGSTGDGEEPKPAKAMTARVRERAQNPNRRGKTVKAKKTKSKVQTMDESLAALQARFNSR